MILENIRMLCSEKGVNINKVERACDLSHGSIRKWDDHSPSVDKAKAVADYFGITVDDLIK